MKARLIRALAMTSVLILVMVLILGRDNIVYGKDRGLSPARYRALPAPARAIAEVARTDLAKGLDLAIDRITVLSVDPANFPDTSLGVIEPGKRYLEATTPGYAVRFLIAGQTYTYHGSRDRMVRVPSGKESAAVVQHLLQSSVSDLRDRLNVSMSEVVVQSIETTEFPDGSLGVPEPNVPYALTPTPGYEILLQAKGVVYRYWSTDNRVAYIGSFLEPARTVTVYLHKDLSPEAGQCDVAYPVQRLAPVASEVSSMVVLQELFAGPSKAETEQGYVSPFSEATAGLVMGVRVDGLTAYIDIADALPAMLVDDTAPIGHFLLRWRQRSKKSCLSNGSSIPSRAMCRHFANGWVGASSCNLLRLIYSEPPSKVGCRFPSKGRCVEPSSRV